MSRSSRLRADARFPHSSKDMSAGPVERRSISISFEDGTRLELSASLPQGAGGHGEEEVRATLSEPGVEPVEVAEALLSTEYGEDGRQRRATLELWVTPEGPPMRGAGHAAGAAENGAGAVPFEWSLEGRAGTGTYAVVRGNGD